MSERNTILIKPCIALPAMDEVIKLYFSINKTNVNVLFDANNELTVNSTATSLPFITSFTALRLGTHSARGFFSGKGELGRLSTSGPALSAQPAPCLPCSCGQSQTKAQRES